MDFNIEEAVDVGEGMVEVRARLEDGRQAILTTEKSGQDVYREVVARYLAKAFPPEEVDAEGAANADG